MVTGFTILGGL